MLIGNPTPALPTPSPLLSDVLASAPDPRRAAEMWANALGGDSIAAADLVVFLPNRSRGLAARAFFDANAPAPVLREAMTVAWCQDHSEVTSAFGLKLLRTALHRCRFDTSMLPARLTVYRGGRAAQGVVARGLSWSTRRDAAAWFAHSWDGRDGAGKLRHNPRTGLPIILKVDVERSHILATFMSRGEFEIVLRTPRLRPALDTDDAAEIAKLSRAWAASSRLLSSE